MAVLDWLSQEQLCKFVLLSWENTLLIINRNNSIRSTLQPFGLDSQEIRLLLDNPQHALNSMHDDVQAEDISAALVPAYRRGFRIVFIVSAVLAALAVFLVFFLMPQVELNRPDDDELKEKGARGDEKA